MDGDFWYKVFIIVVSLLGQIVLWSWVGWQAQRFPWWPIKVDPDLITQEESSQQRTSQ